MKVYEIITNIILEKLEQGQAPWHRPWNGIQFMPKNLTTKKEYQGINAFLLACQAYSSPFWLTFKQCKDLGGSVRKGQQATPVVYWNWLAREEEPIPFLRYYSVFNVLQCEGIPEHKIPAITVSDNDINKIEVCEDIVDGMNGPPSIMHDRQAAFYDAQTDTIHIPARRSFESAEEYYCTLYHELIHATGHGTRLARSGITEISLFGAPSYSKEELIAEMGAAFLCGVAGIETSTLDNSSAYIKGWLQKLRSDKHLVVVAAAQAQKAANYILNTI